MFPNAEKIVDEVMRPVTDVNPSSRTTLDYVPFLGNQFWKAYLTIHWPVKFTVCGRSETQEEARYNVYLQACDTLHVSIMLLFSICFVHGLWSEFQV